MSKHTPGVIRVSDLILLLRSNIDFIEARQQKAKGIATYTQLQDLSVANQKAIDEAERVRALVEAAPEMLQALKDAYDLIVTNGRSSNPAELVNTIQALVAKAEGREE